MTHILIPVDFSRASHNAYRYGLHLAERRGLHVVLVHYYSGSIDPRTNLYIGGDGTIQGSFEARLREFAYSKGAYGDLLAVEPPTGVEVTYEADVSLRPAFAIGKRAEQPDISLVVMASRSSESVLGKWLGSTTTTVSESCDCPVMIVPPDVRHRPIREVVVANNHDTADPAPLAYLEELSDLYGGSRVHFVHVERLNADGDTTFVPWKLMQLIKRRDAGAGFPFEVVTVQDDDISEGLLNFANGIDADLMVVVNRSRKRWQAFLQATLTQDLALRSTLPVLVLHAQSAENPRGNYQFDHQKEA
ncbi:nucleotide-binding universal stress UspA family protein [Neolewinella xylanilytica]|uniref:Nucleotide-binding universal stress UspA family protein n=1 Tax=Neolewinella xylanilytica TaxID=1514080 RepID=A0A2S6I7Z1_9BACT|nr:universal stress protein [Neolewinella xylanilytica]PPK87614.1 nucleotide-binding universal stress UspA family protein [Neolewinella xylanilytica]